MIYIRGGVGISAMKDMPDFNWGKNAKLQIPLQYNIGAGIDIPGLFDEMFPGLILRLEAEYSYVPLFESEIILHKPAGTYKLIGYGPEKPCSYCKDGKTRDPIFIPAFSREVWYKQNYRGSFGMLRTSWALLWRLPFSPKNASLYTGAGFTWSRFLYYKSVWWFTFPEERLNEIVNKNDLDPKEVFTVPVRVGITLHNRLNFEAMYIKDHIDVIKGTFNRKTITLSCSYFLK